MYGFYFGPRRATLLKKSSCLRSIWLQAPPLPKPRSRTESFILITNPGGSNVEDRPPTSHAEATQSPRTDGLKSLEPNTKRNDESDQLVEEKVEPLPQRPVDLYKVCHSSCAFFCLH